MKVVITASPGYNAPTIGELDYTDTTIRGVERQIAVDFNVYRMLVKDELKRRDPVRADEIKDVLKDLHGNLETYWEEIFNPSLRAGYLNSVDGLSDEVAEAAIGRYSGVLADQINAVSDQAFLDGYNAALNKGWDKAIAWDRIATAYGVDPLQMRAWVSYYPSEGYHKDEIPEKSERQLEKMLGERSKRIGSNEAYNLRNLGKQALWEQQVEDGDIPGTAKKVWRTAKDELVCPVCAPMDAIAIDVKDKFHTKSGKFFVPPVHINCRCSVYILHENDIVKRFGNDPYVRDAHGRFALVEGRNRNLSQRNSNMSAFGVQQNATEGPRPTDRPMTEKEKIHALPYKMPDLPYKMMQVNSEAVKKHEKWHKSKKEKEHAKQTDKERAQRKDAKQEPKDFSLNDSPIATMGFGEDNKTLGDGTEVGFIEAMKNKNVGDLVTSNYLDNQTGSIEEISLLVQRNNEHSPHKLRVVVFPKNSVYINGDGVLDTVNGATFTYRAKKKAAPDLYTAGAQIATEDGTTFANHDIYVMTPSDQDEHYYSDSDYQLLDDEIESTENQFQSSRPPISGSRGDIFTGPVEDWDKKQYLNEGRGIL